MSPHHVPTPRQPGPARPHRRPEARAFRICSVLALFTATLLLSPEARAQTIPSGGVSLTNVGDIVVDGSFYANIYNGDPVAARTIVPVTGQSFTQAARIDVQNPDGNFWSSAVTAQSNRAVANGDVVLLHVFMRAIQSTDETGSVFCQVYVEGPAPDYRKSMSQLISAGPEWMEYFLPFQVDGDYASGQFGVKFGFGAGNRPQIIEIAGAEAIWYGTSRTLDDMPGTASRYDGREPDAPWRAEAARRIEEYRKSTYTVRVVNADGLPVEGASVRVQLRRHAFEFGTAFVSSLVVDQSTPDNQMYRAKLLELFNAGGPENDLKWGPWIGEWGQGFNQAQTLAALQTLQDAGFALRGHVLVWPSERNLPNAIADLIGTGAQSTIPQLVLDHIDDEVNATKDFLDEWDVLNEPYDNHDLMDLFGEDIMVDWFNEARIHHPTARLYMNEYSIVSAGGLNVQKQDFFASKIAYLRDQGAPIGGIGIQSHFDTSPTGIPRAWSILERYATEFPDMMMRVTEFDVDSDDESLKADYLRDFLTLVFSHPKMSGFQMWGFWAGAHWRPRAALFDVDWTERANGAAYRDLVFNQWRTDETRTTWLDGRATGRGFHGDYDVTVTLGAQTVTGSLTLEPEGGTATIVVDAAVDSTPRITTQPLCTTVSPGEPATLAFEAVAFPAPQITWFKNGVALNEHDAALTFASASAGDEGTYHAEVTSGTNTIVTRPAKLGVRAPGTRTEKLINISTRGAIGTGDDILIAGFVVTGSTTKEVLVRGVGPRLADLGVTGPVADPVLSLFRSGEGSPLASNDDWDPALAPVFQQVGAFALTNDTKSAALHLDLAPGIYTALLSGNNGSTGIGVVETYDVASGTPLKLVNISTRGRVGTGDGILIAGFVIQGAVPQHILIRGIGPQLAALGVGGVLADPRLTVLENPAGLPTRIVAANDDWSAIDDFTVVRDASATVGAFALEPGSRDAALLLALEPGAYTVHLSGSSGTTGVALVEVYAME